MKQTVLCGHLDCRLLKGHAGEHNARPDDAWSFLQRKDKDKVGKAGYATPRGGDKGAYQNHVYRNNRVIVPYERLSDVDLEVFKDGYVVRVFPDQYFESPGKVRDVFRAKGAPVVGKDAFILYRSYEAYETFPPLAGWSVRGLTRNGKPVKARGQGVTDTGHYVLRLPNAGTARPARKEGPPQGIFAPEYADADVNFLCRAMLVWLIVHTRRSPYTATQADHVKAILDEAGLLKQGRHESLGVTRNGLACCPLCLRIIDYDQLHSTVTFVDTVGLTNAGSQVAGATRSTEVNLFHLVPLVYTSIQHSPTVIGWGHATCNTLLGQRRCFSLAELRKMDLKVAYIHDDEIITFGWISDDWQMIRSAEGAVWVQLCDDMTPEELTGEAVSYPTPPGSDVVDEIAEGALDERTEDVGT